MRTESRRLLSWPEPTCPVRSPGKHILGILWNVLCLLSFDVWQWEKLDYPLFYIGSLLHFLLTFCILRFPFCLRYITCLSPLFALLRVLEIWKRDLKTINEKAAEALADPVKYPNLFPDLSWALKVCICLVVLYLKCIVWIDCLLLFF